MTVHLASRKIQFQWQTYVLNLDVLFFFKRCLRCLSSGRKGVVELTEIFCKKFVGWTTTSIRELCTHLTLDNEVQC